MARGRAEKAGLEDSVRFVLNDYREVEGNFDRIVSVGMFEHVGPRFYQAYFDKCRQLLKPDGVMLLTHHRAHGRPLVPEPLARQVHLPRRPAPGTVGDRPCHRAAGLIVTDVECLRMHYAETLSKWRQRFMARREEARALYDERFCRMWEYYLACCEAAFRYQDVAVFQVQCARSIDAVPLTRDYIAERTQILRLHEAAASAPKPVAAEPVQLRKQRL